MAICEGCENQHAYVVRVRFTKEGKVESCDRCGQISPQRCYDVYLEKDSGVKFNDNISDPKTGQPVGYQTKGEKAALMKKFGIREAGDRIHGSRSVL